MLRQSLVLSISTRFEIRNSTMQGTNLFGTLDFGFVPDGQILMRIE